MLARRKLNSIETKISEGLINNEISHDDFMLIINEEKSYRKLKKSIRLMNSQRKDTEKRGIDEVIKHNECINNSLKSKK